MKYLIGPGLLTCCVLSTTGVYFIRIFQFTILDFSMTVFFLWDNFQLYFFGRLPVWFVCFLPVMWYQCCLFPCSWSSSSRSPGPVVIKWWLSWKLLLWSRVWWWFWWERCWYWRWCRRWVLAWLMVIMIMIVVMVLPRLTWTALSPILSIKPVSSRAPGRSRLLPRTLDFHHHVTTITSITTANIITIITTILIIIISIKPVSSRTMLGSKNFFIFIITTITTNCWWPTQHDNNIHRHHKEKKLFTRIGIPASCGRSSRLCSSLRLAWMVIITIMMMTLVKLTVMVITKYNGDDNYGVGDTGTSILSWSAASTI